jgi:hypothetical protein
MSWRILLSSFYIQAMKNLNNRDFFGDHHRREKNLEDWESYFYEMTSVWIILTTK